MNEEKSFDGTVTRLLRLLQDEFNLNTPVYVLLINPKTQCFHYYGKEYYMEIIRNEYENRHDQMEKKLNKIKNIIKENYLDKLYNFKNSTSPIDQFIEILISTPCSRYYGMIGRIYHTGVPVFCYDRQQYSNSGIRKIIENDSILGTDKQDIFIDIIAKSEELMWGEKFKKIESTMMVPIHLYNQFAGVAFVTNKKAFSYYEYIRFIQIIKEFSITAIKDAKEYEFLRNVIISLPDKNFDVFCTTFENLYILFNISGACFCQNGTYYCLSFIKTSGILPEWKKQKCNNDCEVFKIVDGKNFIDTSRVCKIMKKNELLELKSGLLIDKGDNRFIIYFNSTQEMLMDITKQIKFEIEDVFELINLVEKNLEFFRAYEHDTSRFVDLILPPKRLYRNVANIITNRSAVARILLGDKVGNTHIEFNINQVKSNVENLFQLIQKWKNTKINLKTNIKTNLSNVHYWPSVQAILQNLMSNSFKYVTESGNSVSIKLAEQTNYLIIEYKQFGNFNFEPSPETVKQWLNGGYIPGEEKGFGHYIIQKIADRFDGKLQIILRKGGKSFKITKNEVSESRWNNNQKQEVCYAAYLELNHG